MRQMIVWPARGARVSTAFCRRSDAGRFVTPATLGWTGGGDGWAGGGWSGGGWLDGGGGGGSDGGGGKLAFSFGLDHLRAGPWTIGSAVTPRSGR